jgi:hypothetical protein
MGLPVIEPDLEIHERITGKDTEFQRLIESFFNGRHKVAGHVHPHERVFKLITGASFARRHVKVDLGKLAATA